MVTLRILHCLCTASYARLPSFLANMLIWLARAIEYMLYCTDLHSMLIQVILAMILNVTIHATLMMHACYYSTYYITLFLHIGIGQVCRNGL